MSRILAIDPSLTATGIAIDAAGPDDPTPITTTLRTSFVGTARLAWFRREFTENWLPGVDAVAVEGYAFAKQQGNHQLGELGGVIRLACFDADKRLIVVPPASLKTYATGKGNAPKPLVLVEAVKRLGYTGSSSDEADALWLWYLAHHLVDGSPLLTLPQVHIRALDKLKEA